MSVADCNLKHTQQLIINLIFHQWRYSFSVVVILIKHSSLHNKSLNVPKCIQENVHEEVVVVCRNIPSCHKNLEQKRAIIRLLLLLMMIFCFCFVVLKRTSSFHVLLLTTPIFFCFSPKVLYFKITAWLSKAIVISVSLIPTQK